MTVEFACKNCDTTLRVAKENLGKQARCPKCQSLNIVEPDISMPRQEQQEPASDFSAKTYSAQQVDSASELDNPYAVSQGNVLPGSVMAGQAYRQAHRGGLILGLGIMAICCNIAAVPGVLAWIFGRKDLKLMDAGLMDPEGRGTTQAGMIIGMVMSILALIGFAFMIVYFLFIAIFVLANAGAVAGI